MADMPTSLQIWLKSFNDALAQARVLGISPTPEMARLGLSTITQQFVTAPITIKQVIDTFIHGTAIPCRIYHPSPGNELPVLLFFHGGGHMCGSIEVYDPISRRLAHHSQHVVVTIDYRLSPEHPYPKGLVDCIMSLEEIVNTLVTQNISFRPTISIAGDSAGGALAATLAQRQPDTINQLVLIYPSLDYTLSSGSLIDYREGYILETEKIQWYFDQYFQQENNRQTASPLFGALPSNHPATLLITAGFDPIQDEGKRYLKRLTMLGIDNLHHHLDNMTHAFLNLEDLVSKACDTTYHYIDEFLNR
ncbi:alpha/beta fold hydrolase [Photobacterium sp. DNB23_23_1]|uniref:Alpha/beta hydrolase n=1 Tax=Photobacterium pectinilyticum TaxID=2906793 RepID=A0ABT1N4B8_9GAMM|nr:alpha/beta hydrolase [Photobacterium sp. ZSDE20]MCQ1058089.1 alpha/beta hydrolase [Photobacterium sp. ZSDE20]MDD1822622.1 alpha/beta hydrolase [Photobacterium sp. ZSDE20]